MLPVRAPAVTDPRERAKHAWAHWRPEDIAAELAPWPKETSMEQKPSVGRIVHFRSQRRRPHAAIVVHVDVDDASIVDLRTLEFDPRDDRGYECVRYSPDDETGTWRWPPRVP